MEFGELAGVEFPSVSYITERTLTDRHHAFEAFVIIPLGDLDEDGPLGTRRRDLTDRNLVFRSDRDDHRVDELRVLLRGPGWVVDHPGIELDALLFRRTREEVDKPVEVLDVDRGFVGVFIRRSLHDALVPAGVQARGGGYHSVFVGSIYSKSMTLLIALF